MEITNNFKKMIASLGSSKGRKETGYFIAEGTKCVIDTWNYFSCRYLLATPQWIDDNIQKLPTATPISVKRSDIEKMSQLSTPTNVIAVYDIPQIQPLTRDLIKDKLTLILDRIQDPGNLGTIIRVADWFGVENIVCSKDTADVYNPKVVQATMGAISRVKLHYCNLVEFIHEHCDIPVYGTFLDGDNIYSTELAQQGFIIMGNEGQGISSEISTLVNHRLLIPSFPHNRQTSESLNVGTATAITLAEFRRRTIK